jgi:Zn-dependent protease
VFAGNPYVFLIGAVLLVPAIVIAVPVHEMGHALAAVLAGDPSPRNRGYLRPDLRRFINVYGVIAAILLNVTFGNPAPVNDYRLQGPARKLVHALGGPAASLLAAIVFGILLKVLVGVGAEPSMAIFTRPELFATFRQPPLSLLATVVYAVFFLNLSTFAFQLLPIPGLDGWRVVEVLFRDRNPRFFFNAAANRQTIWAIAAFVVLFAPALLHFSILDPVVAIFFQPTASAILGTCTVYVSLHPCLLSAGF